MIKIQSVICGTICRDAVITTNDKGISNLEFSLRVGLASQSDANASVIIPVVVNDGKREDLKDYIRGNRIVMEGNLLVHKADDEYVLVLHNATPKLAYCVPSQDSISGDLTFTGRVKDPQEKTDKRGMPYLVLSAYSPTKTDDAKDKWEYIWFHFKRFPVKGSAITDIFPEWLKDGVDVEILGDINITSYNGRLNLSSRILEMAQKKAENEQ